MDANSIQPRAAKLRQGQFSLREMFVWITSIGIVLGVANLVPIVVQLLIIPTVIAVLRTRGAIIVSRWAGDPITFGLACRVFAESFLSMFLAAYFAIFAFMAAATSVALILLIPYTAAAACDVQLSYGVGNGMASLIYLSAALAAFGTFVWIMKVTWPS